MSALHQATAVAIGGRGVLIEGVSGTGKSGLALALIDRGAALIGDDGVALALRGGALWAAPAPHTAGLLEIRNVGLVTLPAVAAPVALVLRLDPEAPRHVDEAGRIELLGAPIPMLRLRPAAWPLPLRAEWALRRYGVP